MPAWFCSHAPRMANCTLTRSQQAAEIDILPIPYLSYCGLRLRRLLLALAGCCFIQGCAGLVLQSMSLGVDTARLQSMLLDASTAMHYNSAGALKIKIRVHTILNNTQMLSTSSSPPLMKCLHGDV